MKKTRIYISGEISGTNDYKERFAKAEKYLEAQGYSVINPAKVNAQMPTDTSYEEYMKMSITMLDMCGSIYMLKEWKNSFVANREYGYALAKGITIIFESEV